ncbi:hypothetical protein TCAL_16552 [Tigriopus californicus]|uniref:RETREG1-3/ARL6IP-like N-terminal reticulon-homology domain-containing protein n=2 Tax=Tigriopus californicus TaxID=6832 RepID=A0A553NBL3_TIGCA|nr:ADP-ribosylation factor-like protein 6-interacting protein 1 [Tigriopus californicus]TRY62830.1 hypothetical protein TCAL_16552 [Tigriopus californicus]
MLDQSQVKSGLSNWKEAVILVDSFLGWEKDFYPGILAGVLTLKFLIIWYWDPTLLTFLAVTGIWLSILDYLGPKVLAQVFKPENWTHEKETKYEAVCENIVSGLTKCTAAFKMCHEAKEKKPVVHFAATVTSLLVLSWIGNRINNFFLLFLLVLGLFMLPGLHRRGILQKYCSTAMLKVTEAIKGKDHLKKAE